MKFKKQLLRLIPYIGKVISIIKIGFPLTLNIQFCGKKFSQWQISYKIAYILGRIHKGFGVRRVYLLPVSDLHAGPETDIQ
jgi:hypothetical protein